MKKNTFTNLVFSNIADSICYAYQANQIMDDRNSNIFQFAFDARNDVDQHKSLEDIILKFYSISNILPGFTSSIPRSNHHDIDLYKNHHESLAISGYIQEYILCVFKMFPDIWTHICKTLFSNEPTLKNSEDENYKNNMFFFCVALLILLSVKNFIFGYIFCSINKQISLNTFIAFRISG